MDNGKITFIVPGKPLGKQRARITKSGITFTPKQTMMYENRVAWAFREAHTGPPIPKTCRVQMHVSARWTVPTSWPAWKRKLALDGAIPKMSTPDADNVLKAILDGLNHVAYEDDVIIDRVGIDKQYAEVAEVVVNLWWQRVPQSAAEAKEEG